MRLFRGEFNNFARGADKPALKDHALPATISLTVSRRSPGSILSRANASMDIMSVLARFSFDFFAFRGGEIL
jgi:hypothetical protein